MPLSEASTRRRFLARGLGIVAFGSVVPNFLVRTSLAGPETRPDEPILVVLQLSGGNDGLSTIVPYRNDDYRRNRKKTGIAADQVLAIDDQFGFHPNLTGLADLLDQGHLAVVQAVGYPNPNRSHFKSMDIWHFADNSGRPQTYGWLGRYCDRAFPDVHDPKLTIAVGGGKAPKAIHGEQHPGIQFERPESYRFAAGERHKHLDRLYRKFNRMSASEKGENSSLDFIATTSIDATASSDAIGKTSIRSPGGTSYPRTKLAASLKTVASMIAGGLSTRIYYVSLGGFDTHRGQQPRHGQLMTQLSEAVSAFQKDLASQGNAERVLTMGFSEFGRRVKENASGGTDHGKAGPMFLIGPGVRPGLHGQFPGLADADLDREDLKHQVDFRSVYATVLEKWLQTDSKAVLRKRYPLLDCLS